MVSRTAAPRSASPTPSSTMATRAIWKIADRTRKATPTRSLPRFSRRSLRFRPPRRRPRPKPDPRPRRGVGAATRSAGTPRRFSGSLRLSVRDFRFALHVQRDLDSPADGFRLIRAGLFLPLIGRARRSGLLEAAASAGQTSLQRQASPRGKALDAECGSRALDAGLDGRGPQPRRT